jgi:hypothetical protein
MSDVSSLDATRTGIEVSKTSACRASAGQQKPTILPNVTTILVNILELAQCLYHEEILLRPGNHQLRAFVETVIQNLESLQDVSPVLALVVQSLIDHIHDFVELGRPEAD